MNWLHNDLPENTIKKKNTHVVKRLGLRLVAYFEGRKRMFPYRQASIPLMHR